MDPSFSTYLIWHDDANWLDNIPAMCGSQENTFAPSALSSAANATIIVDCDLVVYSDHAWFYGPCLFAEHPNNFQPVPLGNAFRSGYNWDTSDTYHSVSPVTDRPWPSHAGQFLRYFGIAKETVRTSVDAKKWIDFTIAAIGAQNILNDILNDIPDNIPTTLG